MNELINIVNKMRSDCVSNYVIAGLDSHLLGAGTVRLFENSRNHQDQITPHSHRFDFACLVLDGRVTNRIWIECDEKRGDFFESSTLFYHGNIGEHTVKKDGRSYWTYVDHNYRAGDVYSMTAEQVHSIAFGRGTKVLFFEGPQILDSSIIIEPVVNGEKIPTYEKRPYMFKTQET